MSLQIDWWEIPPYIYKDKDQAVSGIFPDILKRLVHECCDKDPALNNQDNAEYCVNISYSEVASNDSEVVKKHIGTNGTYCGFCCAVHLPQSGNYCIIISTTAIQFTAMHGFAMHRDALDSTVCNGTAFHCIARSFHCIARSAFIVLYCIYLY